MLQRSTIAHIEHSGASAPKRLPTWGPKEREGGEVPNLSCFGGLFMLNAPQKNLRLGPEPPTSLSSILGDKT